MQRILAGTLLAFVFNLGFAQTYVEKEHTGKNYVYVGVQANQLVRQIFNFGSSTPISNPYLLTLGVNSKASGWGINLSHGFNYVKQSDGDDITSRTTNTNENFFRIGFEKKSLFTEKLMISWGFDAVLDLTNNETITRTEFGGGNENEVTTGIKRTAGGAGPRVTLSYHLGQKILIGTECNYYFKTGRDKEIFKTSFNGSPGEETEDKEDFTNFQFNPPVVILLILKL